MNTIHHLPLDSAQRIYERTLTAAQRKHRMGVIDALGTNVAAESDGTPWDLPQECPMERVNASRTHSEPWNDSRQHPQDQNASEGQWHGHTYAQIAFSALVLMGAGLLCLLAGVALGAWIALKRFAL